METVERAKILMAVEKHVLATQVAAAQVMSTELPVLATVDRFVSISSCSCHTTD